tara:strand:- start:5948 stop:6445 length:498 start_codon:yes stop_codon:yes gene_type:complete
MARKRRTFTPVYKAEVVGLVQVGGKAISAVARDLDLTESAVRKWVAGSEVDTSSVDQKELTIAEREELLHLRREIRQLQIERETKNNDGLLWQGIDVTYRFMAAEKALYPVTLMSRLLEVSRSGFYAWDKRAESARTRSDRALVVHIKAAHRASRDIYGKPSGAS